MVRVAMFRNSVLIWLPSSLGARRWLKIFGNNKIYLNKFKNILRENEPAPQKPKYSIQIMHDMIHINIIHDGEVNE
jgi:hypothetical protein